MHQIQKKLMAKFLNKFKKSYVYFPNFWGKMLF